MVICIILTLLTSIAPLPSLERGEYGDTLAFLHTPWLDCWLGALASYIFLRWRSLSHVHILCSFLWLI